ncbi:MAG: hypothetical protein LBH41_01560 [Rickettsiales bacterium]|nr:hypothetical protein [Rickettsiales bacterium]
MAPAPALALAFALTFALFPQSAAYPAAPSRSYWIGLGSVSSKLAMPRLVETSAAFIDSDLLLKSFAAPKASAGVKFLGRYGAEVFWQPPRSSASRTAAGERVSGEFEQLGLAAVYFMGGIHGFELYSAARVSNYRYTIDAEDALARWGESESGLGYGAAIGATYAMPAGPGAKCEAAYDLYDGERPERSASLSFSLIWTF